MGSLVPATGCTRYRTLSTDELLRIIDAARAKSPVIQELCRRLEIANQTSTEQFEAWKDEWEEDHDPDGTEADCPCCKVKLIIASIGDGTMYELQEKE